MAADFPPIFLKGRSECPNPPTPPRRLAEISGKPLQGEQVAQECHVLLSENRVPERMDYGTELFSHRNKDDFIAYLDAVESSATPEHLALVEEVYGAV